MFELANNKDLGNVAVLPDGRVRPSLRMSEQEFLEWCDEDTRAEWVDGEVVLMAAESVLHSDLNAWLNMLLRLFVKWRKVGGRVVGPNVLIRLSEQRRLRVPDLLYLVRERESLVRPTVVDGPPDLSIEIISPDSQSRDRREKFMEYQKAKVREYWIIDPVSRVVEVYALDGSGAYVLTAEQDGRIPSSVVAGFYLRPEWLWQEPLPDVIATLREMGVQI